MLTVVPKDTTLTRYRRDSNQGPFDPKGECLSIDHDAEAVVLFSQIGHIPYSVRTTIDFVSSYRIETYSVRTTMDFVSSYHKLYRRTV